MDYRYIVLLYWVVSTLSQVAIYGIKIALIVMVLEQLAISPDHI